MEPDCKFSYWISRTFKLKQRRRGASGKTIDCVTERVTKNCNWVKLKILEFKHCRSINKTLIYTSLRRNSDKFNVMACTNGILMELDQED